MIGVLAYQVHGRWMDKRDQMSISSYGSLRLIMGDEEFLDMVVGLFFFIWKQEGDRGLVLPSDLSLVTGGLSWLF